MNDPKRVPNPAEKMARLLEAQAGPMRHKGLSATPVLEAAALIRLQQKRIEELERS